MITSLNIIRIILGLIPGIGGLFLMAFVFDHTKMNHWKYWSAGIMIIHIAYFLWVISLQ